METLENLPKVIITLVLIAMVIGVGVIMSEKFGAATSYSRTGYNDTVALTVNNTRYALDKGNITGVTAVWNSTFNLLPSACYQIFGVNGSMMYVNDTADCAVFANTAYVIYDYTEYATASRNVLTSTGKEISNISTQWLGLIVTMIVLSIILGYIILSMGSGLKRN